MVAERVVEKKRKSSLRRLILELGKQKAIASRHVDNLFYSTPFDTALYGLLLDVIGNEALARTAYFRLKLRQEEMGFENMLEFVEYLSKSNPSAIDEALKSEIKSVVWIDADMSNAVEGLLEIGSKFILENPSILKYWDPNSVYRALMEVFGPRYDLVVWIICEFCRFWGLEIPYDLKLGKKLREKLEVLGLSEEDFSPAEYPYVNLALSSVV